MRVCVSKRNATERKGARGAEKRLTRCLPDALRTQGAGAGDTALRAKDCEDGAMRQRDKAACPVAAEKEEPRERVGGVGVREGNKKSTHDLVSSAIKRSDDSTHTRLVHRAT